MPADNEEKWLKDNSYVGTVSTASNVFPSIYYREIELSNGKRYRVPTLIRPSNTCDGCHRESDDLKNVLDNVKLCPTCRGTFYEQLSA